MSGDAMASTDAEFPRRTATESIWNSTVVGKPLVPSTLSRSGPNIPDILITTKCMCKVEMGVLGSTEC